jgi:EF-hand domain pair
MRWPGAVMGGKICRGGHRLPGSPVGRNAGKPGFATLFTVARPLLKNLQELSAATGAAIGSLAMFLALGAASSALDALKALTSSKPSSAPSTGRSQNPQSPFDLLSPASTASAGASAGGGRSQISPETMSALLALQGQPPEGSAHAAAKGGSSLLKDLFAQIDGDGDGKITQSEFGEALGAGGSNRAQADSVFGKLDKDGDESVNLAELAAALKGAKGRHRHDHAAGGVGGSNPLSQALQGATTTSVTNSDGSVTTSLTYADGSKVAMTSAAGGSSSSAATSSYNFIEQMIQRQARAISSAAAASLSVSA